jgi:hypothetical protein
MKYQAEKSKQNPLIRCLASMTDNMKQRCDLLLQAMVGPNLVEKWWQSRNKAFDMKTAKEQFDIDPQVVYNYLMGQALR